MFSLSISFVRFALSNALISASIGDQEREGHPWFYGVADQQGPKPEAPRA